MNEKKQDMLTDHAYDGIQEYDNPTPSWWTWLFVGSILFSAVYFLIVTLANEQLSPRGNFARNKAIMVAKSGDLEPTAENILMVMDMPALLDQGQKIFIANCAACHANDGSGMLNGNALTGPNLTDDTYINITTVADLHAIVLNGTANGAMPAWNIKLSQKERVLVAGYVASLRGKNLPGKPAEGTAIAQWK
jgi:cytochrome c oxidase cbb3-type subunit III